MTNALHIILYLVRFVLLAIFFFFSFLANRINIYCGDIIAKYEDAFPLWAFIEIVPFGRLVAFYGFYADRFSDKSMKDTFYRLLTCKEIRNASAHNNCILNNLKAKTAAHSTNAAVTSELMKTT